MRFLVLAATAAFMTAGVTARAQPMNPPPPASPPSSPGAPSQDAPVKKKDPVICKRQEETGSRLGGKQVCMTKSQWDEQRADAQRGLAGAQATPH
jgi:hypothetical protein